MYHKPPIRWDSVNHVTSAAHYVSLASTMCAVCRSLAGGSVNYCMCRLSLAELPFQPLAEWMCQDLAKRILTELSPRYYYCRIRDESVFLTAGWLRFPFSQASFQILLFKIFPLSSIVFSILTSTDFRFVFKLFLHFSIYYYRF